MKELKEKIEQEIAKIKESMRITSETKMDVDTRVRKNCMDVACLSTLEYVLFMMEGINESVVN